MKILVTGGNGMLASELQRLDRSPNEINFVNKDELDITNSLSIRNYIQSYKPQIIINCAAYTNVEHAEEQGKKVNFDVNSRGVYLLAKIAKEIGSDFITISTDYVFDGTQPGGYTPQEKTNPISNYGVAKSLGEQLCRDIYPESIIIRTSRLYGGGSEYKNFVTTMLDLSKTKSQLNIINDQWGNPTYAGDLAVAIQKTIYNVHSYRGSVLHLTNETHGSGTTRYNFACKIFELSGKNIICAPISSKEYITKAIRPQYSILLNTSQELYLPFREESLKKFLTELFISYT